MKTLILAGGLGTRLSEETNLRPKPMVEIGEFPILWHIMKIYSYYGFNDFILLCGYKHQHIKDYFVNYYLNNADITIDLKTNDIEVHATKAEDWKVTILNTGLDTLTGSRIKMAQKYVGNEQFMVTYGDGVSDVNIPKLIDFHNKQGKIGTLTAVKPSGRFGALDIDGSSNINSFIEKPQGDGNWVNGGFFVFEPEFFNYIPDSNVMLEQTPLLHLVKDNELSAYKHEGFWKPMDTLRDKIELNKMWESHKAPWKVWN